MTPARSTQESTLVALLDHEGRLAWTSSAAPRREWGELVEEYVRENHRQLAKATVRKAVEQHQIQQIQITNDVGQHFRVWIWPIESGSLAICALAIRIPSELALLSLREQDCLKLLGAGRSVAEISSQLGVAVSTVHTHFQRARVKLKLTSLEAMISLASRHQDTFREFDRGVTRAGESLKLRPRKDGARRRPKDGPASTTSADSLQLGPNESHVLICDWMGKLKWTSRAELYPAYGQVAWDYVSNDDREEYRESISRVMTRRVTEQIDVECDVGGRYRAWLWPLDWPDAAICVMALRIPDEMKLLTPREAECLAIISQGLTVAQLAIEMDISQSTIHTLLRRARAKLQLSSLEELVSFAARYCYPRIADAPQLLGANRRRDRAGPTVKALHGRGKASKSTRSVKGK